MTLQAKELRIGNFINRITTNSKEVTTIKVEVGTLAIIEQPVPLWTFAPIELTEEWLQRFGGKKNPENGTWRFNWGENGVLFVFLHNGYDLYSFQLGAGLSKPVKFVHQFQNFFFAFTENELTIKPKNENKRT